MNISDRLRQFLSIVDREVGLDVFFEAACNYPHDVDSKKDEQLVMDIMNEMDRDVDLHSVVDRLILWEYAETELGLDDGLFVNLNETIEQEIDE